MSAAECNAVSGPACSILFVHGADEEFLRLNRIFMDAASELYVAETGGEALELLRNHRPCLVISALALGDMTGFELCARVLESDCGSVVALIGRDEGVTAYRQAMEAGAVRYLVLAEAVDTLETVIADCCRLSRSGYERMEQLRAFRQQADVLRALPLPVALLAPDAAIVFANRAFVRLAGVTGDGAGVALAAALNSLPAVDPDNGWGRLLDAAIAGLEWSGEVSCRVLIGMTAHIRATLTRVASAGDIPPSAGGLHVSPLLLALADVTVERELTKGLAVQRNSVFDVLGAHRHDEDSLNTMLSTLSQLPDSGSASGQNEQVHAVTRQLRSFIVEVREKNYLAHLLTAETVPTVQQFSLRALITTVEASVHERFKKRNLELRMEVPLYLPDFYLGDQRAVRSVLSSLLVNSLESCDGDEVSVTVAVKEKTPSGLVIQFSVDYASSGVPCNRFEIMRDYLACQGLTGGTGNRPDLAGLSLAAALVDRLGGKVWVKSTAKKGRTYCFSIHLPESASDESRDGGAGVGEPGQTIWSTVGLKEGAAATPTRILLAEDGLIDQLAIQRLLENRGIEVTCVSNGREAVDEFDRAAYDAVLMDILMPEMDGFEATRLIREKERVLGSRTPIIALSAYSLKAVHDKCISVGMDGYLSKPVSTEELARLFGGLLRAESTTQAEPLDRDLPLLDIRDTISNLGDDENLYREIIALFCEKAPVVHAELLEAIRTGKCEEVMHLAHKLKGMSSNIGAKRYAALARLIQDSSLAGSLADSSLWLDSLAGEFQQLRNALAAINLQELS